MTAWISVKERLPEPSAWYVVLSEWTEVDFETKLPVTIRLLSHHYPGTPFIPSQIRRQWWVELPPPPIVVPEEELKA